MRKHAGLIVGGVLVLAAAIGGGVFLLRGRLKPGPGASGQVKTYAPPQQQQPPKPAQTDNTASVIAAIGGSIGPILNGTSALIDSLSG